jgi:hypothetical protein
LGRRTEAAAFDLLEALVAASIILAFSPPASMKRKDK